MSKKHILSPKFHFGKIGFHASWWAITYECLERAFDFTQLIGYYDKRRILVTTQPPLYHPERSEGSKASWRFFAFGSE
jgi:hypothetical protein